MTLLDQIIDASTNPQISDEPLKYPFPLSANSVLETLEIDPENPNPNSFSLLIPLTGFQVSNVDSTLIEFNAKFFENLKGKLKNPNSISSYEFIDLIRPFFEGILEIKFGGLGDVEMGIDAVDYVCKLIGKFGSFVGRDVMGLIIEGSFVVEIWKFLEVIIVNKLVDHEKCSYLVRNLVEKRRSELICLFVKHYKDMNANDLCSILKYFLCPSKDALVGMTQLRKEWESEALLAIEKASNKLGGKKLPLAKEAALLFMVAYDGFSSWELCLHYLVSSCVENVVFSSAINKLNAEELLGLIKYLGKWLRKYERFPQAKPCPKAIDTWRMNLLQWVPRIDDVVKCYGLVVDEHFSSLVMRVEYHDELKSIEEVITSLASEGRLCCSVANLKEILKPEVIW
ncbi:hypothetical protein RND81_10G219800 [Saponaria officinalis]|uniref:Uncharacterized protein n=1 Tax=Saponaria officinalis TaxID=3572 RepID=A0AAW1I7H1_SAPOF